MPLSINPLAKLVGTISSNVSPSALTQGTSLGNISDKIQLDNTVDRLAGGLTSGFNGLAAPSDAPQSGLGNTLTQGAQTLLSGANTALQGVGSAAQTFAQGASNTLQSVTGTISNISADAGSVIGKLTGGDLASGIQNIAGVISASAGMLNNILSLTRAVNLPAGGELFTSQNPAIKLEPAAENDWRVRITCNWDIFGSNQLFQRLQSTGGVVWPYTPTVQISTRANYNSVDPVHGNYSFHAYKNSQINDISISGQFSAETEADAGYWIAATTFFRTATKMFFGQGENAGNPPIICNLRGYGASVFDNVPVVIKSFDVEMPPDVNYVKCNIYGTSTWVPILSTISVTVAPVYNRARLRKFDLTDYARGGLISKQQGGGIGYF